MVNQMAPGIYRISVTLPGNPMKYINSYYIPGKDRDLLIDTGFRRQECRQALEEGLKELGSRRERRDVFITHIHSDHSGLAAEMAAPDGTIYMSQRDLERLKLNLLDPSTNRRYSYYIQNGFTEELVAELERVNPAYQYMLPEVDSRFRAVTEGDRVQAGEYRLQVLEVPGHTPGNLMLWAPEQGIMFTGDHVLFDISPNITCFWGVEDSLGLYLESLKKTRNYPVRLALPGHREPGDYTARVDALLAHHDRRLQGAEEIVREEPGLNACEIAGRMRWKIRAKSWEEFPLAQKWFAVGEAISHLDHLVLTGRIRRLEQDGKYFYVN